MIFVPPCLTRWIEPFFDQPSKGVTKGHRPIIASLVVGEPDVRSGDGRRNSVPPAGGDPSASASVAIRTLR
jgi:hypothetical protein